MNDVTSKFPVPGVSPERRRFWQPLVEQVLKREPAPLFLFSSEPVWEALNDLNRVTASIALPVRHWFSCKTQPLPALLKAWNRRNGCIEVVSALEFEMARASGYDTDRMLVNGPAKQTWLAPLAAPGQRVHFDSIREIRALAPQASRQKWRIGLRLLLDAEFDPEHPECPTQFGLSPDEAAEAVRLLRRKSLEVESVHFHLRTNLPSPEAYRDALTQAAQVCRDLKIFPKAVDCGGGFPPPWARHRDGLRCDRKFNFRSWAAMVSHALKGFSEARELWLENGRFLTARSGVLLVKVVDSKMRRGMRHLICNGGKTLQALVSHWEMHEMWTLPSRSGRAVSTSVSGPTCMAFDRIARGLMPSGLKPGDHLIWMDAGAYHLPWETRFSHGLAPVWWHDGDTLQRVRRRETFEDWWSGWD